MWSRVLCVSLLLVSSAVAQELVGGEDVVDVTSENWEEQVKADKWTLVEYYSPSCGYCRAFAPEYAKVGTYLKGAVKVARINVLEEKEKWQATKARGVPHVQLFAPDVEAPLVFDGARDAISVVNWVIEQLPVLYFSKEEDMKAYMYPGVLVYPTRTLVVAPPAMADDPGSEMFAPLDQFKDKKALAAVWPVLDDSSWEYPLPTLVVNHALQLTQEYYIYEPKSINFNTLLENVEVNHVKMSKPSIFSATNFTILFCFVGIVVVYRYFCRASHKPKIHFHKQGERLATVALTSVIWEGEDKIA